MAPAGPRVVRLPNSGVGRFTTWSWGLACTPIPFLVYTVSEVWTIREHRQIEKTLTRAPAQVRKKYEFWKNVVRHSGPEGLATIRGFNDEALAGRWQGYRSSRLNQAYRVIYKVERDHLLVNVERVSKHDYRA